MLTCEHLTAALAIFVTFIVLLLKSNVCPAVFSLSAGVIAQHCFSFVEILSGNVYMQGKDKVDFAPHLDNGDVVIVKNAQHVVFTGKKWKQKLYRHHTG